MIVGSRQRHSLYFDYVEYPFERPPELDGVDTRRQVVVVGAGPAGLNAVLPAARAGLRVVLIEEAHTLGGSLLARECNGINPGKNHVRVALVAPLEECVEAAHRMRTFISK